MFIVVSVHCNSQGERASDFRAWQPYARRYLNELSAAGSTPGKQPLADN